MIMIIVCLPRSYGAVTSEEFWRGLENGGVKQNVVV
jgi:hypothetical protein